MSDAVLLAKGNGEHLLNHSLDVMQHVIMLSEDLSQTERKILRLAAGFHDLGKSWSDFQKKLVDGTETNPKNYRHEIVSLAFLGGIDDEDTLQWTSYLVAHHHKTDRKIKEAIYKDDIQISRRVVSGLPDLSCEMKILGLPPAAPTVEAMNRAKKALRAIRGVEKSIQPRLKNKNFINQKFLLKGILVYSDWLASSGEKPKGRVIISRPDFGDIKLYDHQKEIQEKKGHAQVIGPTGSGKTETACIYLGEQGVTHCFYCLPNNASLNAMEPRLDSAFSEMVRLQHGNSRDEYYLRDFNRQLAKQKAKEARLYIASILLTTIYQIIKPFYRPTGYEIATFIWRNACFIFDEIHAYEPERLGFLFAALEYLNINYNCLFLFMSATFPNLISNKLDTFIPDRYRIEVDKETCQTVKRHVLRMRNGDLLDYLDEAIAEAKQGKSVVLRFNWIKRAAYAYEYIKQRYKGQVKLLHSEYTPDDRRKIEASLNDGGVLVTTQVIEVSLNLDFNRGYSDIAPIDALIQFFGRVNRFGNLDPVDVTIFTGGPPKWKIYSTNLIQYTKDALWKLNGQVLDEHELRMIVNEVYDRYTAEWELEYKKGENNFANLVSGFVPGNANKALIESYYETFTGYKVLPERFKAKYAELIEGKEYEMARTLLVPISKWSYLRLKSKIKKEYYNKDNQEWEDNDKDNFVYVVYTEYDSEYGLRKSDVNQDKKRFAKVTIV